MKVTLKKRSGRILDTIEINENATVEEFKTVFYENHKFYTERQRWNVGKASGPPLKTGTLAENGVTEDTTLFFKDLGVQISWRLVYVIEYVGPLFIFPILYFMPNLVYGQSSPKSLAQESCFYLAIFHFFKREMETLFVHRFSNGTMPIYRLPINCAHYWLLFGVSVGYYLFHPKYTPVWTDDDKFVIYGFNAAIVVFEILNFKTHIILRNLRPRGTKARGIPMGWGFGMTSVANYTWEMACWICFSSLAGVLTSWAFTIVAFAQMAQWAIKKHAIYKKEFKDYPRARKAIIPFIL